MPYQSIISCRRVVLRLKWWNFGWTAVVSDIGGSLWSGRGREGQLLAQVVDQPRQIGGVGCAAEDVEVGAHEHRVRPVLAQPAVRRPSASRRPQSAPGSSETTCAASTSSSARSRPSSSSSGSPAAAIRVNPPPVTSSSSASPNSECLRSFRNLRMRRVKSINSIMQMIIVVHQFH